MRSPVREKFRVARTGDLDESASEARLLKSVTRS
jgi:hypothetical protein